MSALFNDCEASRTTKQSMLIGFLIPILESLETSTCRSTPLSDVKDLVPFAEQMAVANCLASFCYNQLLGEDPDAEATTAATTDGPPQQQSRVRVTLSFAENSCLRSVNAFIDACKRYRPGEPASMPSGSSRSSNSDPERGSSPLVDAENSDTDGTKAYECSDEEWPGEEQSLTQPSSSPRSRGSSPLVDAENSDTDGTKAQECSDEEWPGEEHPTAKVGDLISKPFQFSDA